MPYGWGLYQGENLVRGERREENIVDLQKRRGENREDLQNSSPAGHADEKALRQHMVV